LLSNGSTCTAYSLGLQLEVKEREAMERLAVDRVEEVVKERDDRAAQCRGAHTQLDNLRKAHAALTSEVEGEAGLRALVQALTDEIAAMPERLIDVDELRHQMAVKSQELTDERAQVSKLTTDVEKLPALLADNERSAELSEINAALAKELREKAAELAEYKRVNGLATVLELKGVAARSAEEVRQLKVTVCEQMELLSFQAQRVVGLCRLNQVDP
jgi:hypothetical protein